MKRENWKLWYTIWLNGVDADTDYPIDTPEEYELLMLSDTAYDYKVISEIVKLHYRGADTDGSMWHEYLHSAESQQDIYTIEVWLYPPDDIGAEPVQLRRYRGWLDVDKLLAEL